MKFLFIPVIIGATTIVKKFKEKFGSRTRNTFNRFITKDRYAKNITHNTDSTAV
jgi:hypothetical protein